MRRLAPLFLLSLFLSMPLVAHAEDHPLFDTSRLSLALGTNYVWFSSGDTEEPGFCLPVNEFEGGPVAAYNLLAKEYTDNNGNEAYKPLLSLSGSVMYGLDSKMFRTSLGLRLMLYTGGN